MTGITVDHDILAIVRMVGRPGGRVLHAGCGDGVLVQSLLGEARDSWGVERSERAAPSPTMLGDRLQRAEPHTLPFGERHFATVIVSAEWLGDLDEPSLVRALAELARVAADVVVVQATGSSLIGDEGGDGRGREWWETRLFAAGLRRHTLFMARVGFEGLEDESLGAYLVMQPLPPGVADLYPMSWLKQERDLHMDMLRETGRRADAHVARYEWARTFVKPGDLVVDVACGLGYGTALLWDGTEAKQVVGVDLSPRVVDYARACYAPGRPGLSYEIGDAEAWEGWSDHSVDCIVSFETLEHLADPPRFLAGARRVLKPGRRFLCAVPNCWVDETGRDPNPWHRHVFDLERLITVATTALLVDEVYAQSAGGHATRFAPRRTLRSVGWPRPEPQLSAQAEWWLLSGVKNPLSRVATPYVEQVFPSTAGRAPNATGFARDYQHPWLVYTVVLGPFRVRSAQLRCDLATRWLTASPRDSADAGAALCVLAYLALEGTASGGSSELLTRIAEYCAGTPRNPQVYRWQVSLLFAAGRLHLCRGDLGEAERWFRRCARQDATSFTPHLETKTTEAGWLAGRLALERGDRAAAQDEWTHTRTGLDRLKAASTDDWLVRPDRPAPFEYGDGLREIAGAIDNAALCGNGLYRLNDSTPVWRPGARHMERNFQLNTSELLSLANRQRGRIDRLRAELRVLQDGWRAAREELDAARRQLARACAERTALHSRARRVMQRVAIFGIGDPGRQVWTALAQCGTVDVRAFVAERVPSDTRVYLGLPVHGLSWLQTADLDTVAVASRRPEDDRRLVEGQGIDPERVVVLPVDQETSALTAAVRQRFPDPLLAWLAHAPDRPALRVGIFGTGAAAMKVWEAVAEIDTAETEWFADNDARQHGRSLLWVDVISPTDIRCRGVDVIIIGSMSRESIRQQLIALGVPSECILTPEVHETVARIREQLLAALSALASSMVLT